MAVCKKGSIFSANQKKVMKSIYTSPLGLGIYKSYIAEDEISYTITGYPKKSSTGLEFDSAYDFEEYVQKKVRCEGIVFDSESCQFFAYTKTSNKAKKFVEDLEKWFQSIL